MSLEQRDQRRADVQGLRAVAVLLVVAFHADTERFARVVEQAERRS